MIVLDASVAVKWYIPEALSELADALFRDHAGSIAAPSLFETEIVGALVRRANIDKSTRAEVEEWLAHLSVLFEEGSIATVDMGISGTQAAAVLALDLGHPLKDCLYLQLAIERECQLVTADARFAARARGAYAGVVVLGE